MPARSLRDIPSVDELLSRPPLAELAARTSRGYVASQIREVLDEIRAEFRENRAATVRERGPASDDDPLGNLEQRIAEHAINALAPSLIPVVNATGVILHTNLGRAPLSSEAADRVRQAAASYTNLEYDLAAGRRGKRDVHAARLLERLLGAPAVVVNNNAAAVLLVLNSLAEGGEVVVSRGELIEIGDSFRIPEIMAKSGALLHEVGTTNRTRLADFEAALSERTRLLLRVHPSNFRVVGFTERASLEDLVALGRRSHVPVFEDLGSGCLFDLRPYGIEDEPVVADSLRAGADIVSFSGDKLLGGPQAGIIAGRRELIDKVRSNPLFRALRVDKMTYAALEATLADCLAGRLESLPVVRMTRMSAEQVAVRARAFIERLSEARSRGRESAPPGLASQVETFSGMERPRLGAQGAKSEGERGLSRTSHLEPRTSGLRLELVPGRSVVGGGSTPGQFLATTLIAVTHPTITANELESRLRASRPPVIARVEEDRLLLDLRTVFSEQEVLLEQMLLQAGGASAT